MKLKLKLCKRYFIKVFFRKLINLLVELLLFLLITLIIIAFIAIYLYINNCDIISCIDITEIKNSNLSNDNLLKEELNKIMDLFRNKNYKYNYKLNNMSEYLYPLYRSCEGLKSPIINELNNFAMRNEILSLKDEIYSLKLQVSEFESIGTLGVQVMYDFNKFWGEFQNYLRTES